ncbi:MAG: hypothetical protein IJ583_17345 [Firmicutes bacterium]|nr:hypothetical protein [Bacillota bacterium]
MRDSIWALAIFSSAMSAIVKMSGRKKIAEFFGIVSIILYIITFFCIIGGNRGKENE